MNTAVAILLSIGFSCFMRLIFAINRCYLLKKKKYKLKEIKFINILKLFEINNIKDFLKMLIPFYNLYNELDNFVKFELNHDKYIKELKEKNVIVMNTQHSNKAISSNASKKDVINNNKPYSYFNGINEVQEYSKPKTLVLKKNRNCR